MTIFYHYTCRHNLDLILNDGLIKLGSMVNNLAQKDLAAAVSLTTDPRPEGHGLPDGRELTKAEANYLKSYYENKDGRLFAADHTKFRLGIKIDEKDFYLKKADVIHDPLIIESLNVAGYLPVTDIKKLPDVEFKNLIYQLSTGAIEGKGGTWWYYFKEIPLKDIQEISFRSNTDRRFYHQCTVGKIRELLQKELESRPK